MTCKNSKKLLYFLKHNIHNGLKVKCLSRWSCGLIINTLFSFLPRRPSSFKGYRQASCVLLCRPHYEEESSLRKPSYRSLHFPPIWKARIGRQQLAVRASRRGVVAWSVQLLSIWGHCGGRRGGGVNVLEVIRWGGGDLRRRTLTLIHAVMHVCGQLCVRSQTTIVLLLACVYSGFLVACTSRANWWKYNSMVRQTLRWGEFNYSQDYSRSWDHFSLTVGVGKGF